MKRKHVIATFALSALLGVGVFAGLHAHEAREARADETKVLYLDPNIWNQGASEKYYGWLFGGTSADKWYTFTLDGDYYKAEVASDYTKVIFLRSGPSMEPGWTKDTNYWNRTGDETFGANNLFTVNAWGSDTSTGAWSSYTPTAPAVYKASIGGGAAQTLVANPDNASEVKLASDVTLTAGQTISFTKDEEALAVTAKAGGTFATNNIDAELKIKKTVTGNLYLNKSSKEVWVTGYAVADGNAYLVGSLNSWSGIEYGSAVTTNVATFQNIDLAANAVFKAYVYDEDGATDDAKKGWVNPTSVEMYEDYGGEYTATIDDPDGDKNVKVAVAGNYDISVNTSTGVYTIKANDYVEHAYTIKIGDGAPAPMTRDGSEYKLGGVTVAAGDTFTFTKDSAAYAATAENASNNNYGSHGVRKGGTVNIYLKPASDEFWVSGTVAPEEDATYYMLINDKNPVKMTDNTAQTANEYYLTHVELAVDDEISFLYVSDDQADPTVYAYYNITTLKEGSVDFYKTDSNKVKTAGIYDLYADMTNENNKLYVAENHDGWVRYLDVNGTKHAMEVNPGNPDEYFTSIALEAGDELAYYFGPNEAGATEQTTTAKAIHNNNLNADKEVLVDTETAVTVYVDTNAGTIWVGGLADGYHIIKNGHTLVTMTHAAEQYEGFDQWYSNSVEFAKDDTLLFLNASVDKGNALPEVFGIGTINEAGLGDKFETVAGTPVQIKAKEAVTTKVYLKLKYQADEVYFGAEDEWVALAKEFVAGFKTAMQTACAAEGKQAAVEAAWAGQATAFAALTQATKETIEEGGSSSVAEIREFAERYIAIKKQHSGWTLANFLEWEIPASNYNIFGIQMNDSGAMIAIFISAFAAISACGVFFIIRRRRQLNK